MYAVPPRPLRLTLALGAIGAMACAHPGQVRPGRPLPSVTTQASTRPGLLLPSATVNESAPAQPLAPQGGGPESADFATTVRPLLEARCQPCHFPGGKVYEKLPFDRAGTILRLREKLFTRIGDERQRQTIREFLSRHGRGGEERKGAG